MNLRKRFLVCISVVLSMVLLTACPTIVNSEGEVIFGESISTDASSVLESVTTVTETTLFIPTVSPSSSIQRRYARMRSSMNRRAARRL